MKIYNLVFSDSYIRSFKKLDPAVQRRILKWIKTNLLDTTDPRFSGKPLVGNYKGWWRYRIGDYRLIVEIRDGELIVVAIDIGHRKDIYE